ncbi:MAG: hypothetical protein JO296_01590 [Pseudonocardiales bacterium]|nr:hypothetical protein [Pseudonocardiales bacterium]MBV9648816.1 hypothetical protein [Pseudonocardiales bacterium]
MLLWIIRLIKVERDSFRKVPQSFVDCAAMAGHIDLKALRYAPVLFQAYRGSESAPHGRLPQCDT